MLRTLRHLTCSGIRTRMLFTAAVCQRIEVAIGEAERRHRGEIRFAIESALRLPAIWSGLSPRERALQVFGQLRVWDTEANNGVLIYVLRADRAIEIIADRGISRRVPDADWQGLCREVEVHFKSGRYAEGSLAAVDGVARLLGRHFPPRETGTNELPNQPVLL